MATQVPPKKNAAFTFYVGLVSQANGRLLQVNPTLAAGDVKVSTDGAALGNIATLPVVTPAGGRGVLVSLSAGEMNGDNVQVVFSDAAGAEWCDLIVGLQTAAKQIDDLSTYAGGDTSGTTTLLTRITAALGIYTAADVRTAVGLASANLDVQLATILADVLLTATPTQVATALTTALSVTTYAEPGAVPAATASLAAKIGWLMALARNKITQTAVLQTLRNDADSGDIGAAAVSDDGTTATRAEWT